MIVFAGGIGENAPDIREKICEDLDFLGLKIDLKKNSGIRAKEAVISHESSKVRVLVVPTNEELVIAEDTVRIISKMNKKAGS